MRTGGRAGGLACWLAGACAGRQYGWWVGPSGRVYRPSRSKNISLLANERDYNRKQSRHLAKSASLTVLPFSFVAGLPSGEKRKINSLTVSFRRGAAIWRRTLLFNDQSHWSSEMNNHLKVQLIWMYYFYDDVYSDNE